MVKSPLTDVELVEVPFHQVVFDAMQMFSDRVGLVDGITGREYTFAEMSDKIKSIASGLRRMGLRHRDIVAFISPNSVDYVLMFYSVLACGAAISTINPVYTVYEISKHLEDSKAQMLFLSPETAKTALEASRQSRLNQTAIVSGTYPDCVTVDKLSQDDGSFFPEPGTIPFDVKEDIAIIPYSSGTTGLPKGVMITHFNLVSSHLIMSHPDMAPQEDIPDQPAQKVGIAFLPYFHIYGMMLNLVGSVLRGYKQIIIPRFEPERFLQIIEQYKNAVLTVTSNKAQLIDMIGQAFISQVKKFQKNSRIVAGSDSVPEVTTLTLVPPVIVYLTKSPLARKYDLSSVKSIMSAAAPLSKETEQEFTKLFNISEIKQGYGMTEASGGCTFHPSINALDKPGSCGIPVPNLELQVVDPETKKILGPNERGELWVRGPSVMKGYLNRPDATREALDEQGWLHTGDVGYYDEDRYFYIVDRIKELIKYKAFQVAPAELEALLLNHPAIDDVAVIGVPDQSAGELPKAYIVRKPGAKISQDEVKQFVADHVSSFKHLRGGVEFVSIIPKSPSGKILRKELRAKLTTSKI